MTKRSPDQNPKKARAKSTRPKAPGHDDPRSPELSPRHRRFVEEFLVDRKGGAAAQRAGFSPNNLAAARVTACRLLKNPHIRAAVQAGEAAILDRLELSQDAARRQLAALVHFDIRRLYDEEGQLLPVDQLPADVAACVTSIKVRRETEGRGEDATAYDVVEIRVADKRGSLELAMKHLGMLREQVEVTQKTPPTFNLIMDPAAVKAAKE